MGYLSIINLYKVAHVIDEYKEWYALEKIHGTSAHMTYRKNDGKLGFFSGGENYERFSKLFDSQKIRSALDSVEFENVIFYGEAYGGKQQGMKEVYGDQPKFIVFDVMLNGKWLNVPDAEAIGNQCGLEFVFYEKVKSTAEELNNARDRPSTQAIRNGKGGDHKSEGVVIRPLEESVDKYGERMIYKHKAAEFSEHKTPKNLGEKAVVMENNLKIAEDWVTERRLEHVLQKLKRDEIAIDHRSVIEGMLEDVKKESIGELTMTPELSKMVKQIAGKIYKTYLNHQTHTK